MFLPIIFANQLLSGTGDTAIVCGWTPVKKVAIHFAQEDYGVIGSLYSPTRGIDVLVRNLLANPSIRKVVILGGKKEDKNAGAAKCLADFFSQGFAKGKRINNKPCWVINSDINGYIEEDIDEEALIMLRSRIKVFVYFDSHNYPYYEIIKLNKPVEPTLEKAFYFYTQQVESKINPGIKTGHSIQAETIKEAWLKILHLIRTTGNVMRTANGGEWQEITNLMITVNNEQKEFVIPKDNFLPINEDFLKQYIEQFISEEVQTDSYTYGGRIRSYFKNDQLKEVKAKLLVNKNSTRAVINLWDSKGENEDNPPCLNHIWFRINNNNELIMTCVFRSNEMFTAWLSNIIGLRSLQSNVFDSLLVSYPDLKIGSISTLSNSAHIYDDSMSSADEILEKYFHLGKEDYSDPCGNFLITTKERSIQVVQTTPGAGEEVRTFSGKSPLTLVREIAYSSPEIQPGHIGYLGIELNKAKTAILSNEIYIQDN
jgi:thymidylate synthase